MNNATQWLFVLAPFLMFAAVFAIAFLGVHTIVRKLRDNLTSAVNGAVNGRELHLRSPWGSLDVHPSSGLDPRLAKIMLYPGAAPVESGASSFDAELHLPNREIKETAARFWTSTPEQIVWEFYQRELPDWQQKPGRKLVKEADGLIQGIQLHTVGDRTIIEIAISTTTVPAGASSSS